MVDTSQAVPAAPAPTFQRSIHLLYVPTLCCNLDCAYCYLGAQTTQAALKVDAARAVPTLRHALEKLRNAGVLAFNVSLHGGEVTTLPEAVLDELFTLIRQHYLDNFDVISLLGHKKSVPHIKTNLYKFAPLYELFERHRVSISASIDLPLSLHDRYRTTRGGKGWLKRAHDNLRLLARYPHAKKISATLCSEHLQDIPAIIDDIRFIHEEIGFDMNAFNIMFAFASAHNRSSKGSQALEAATEAQQLALYEALNTAFMGSDLEDGLRRNWFDEFTPGYCTNAYNCGERFYLLQSDGSVYSCVRGQGIEEFRYGNILSDPVEEILSNGARKIERIHQACGFDERCQQCAHVARCHTGCPVVKFQRNSGRSYTCELQQRMYADHPLLYPLSSPEKQRAEVREYRLGMHPLLAFADDEAPPPQRNRLQLPNDLCEEKNTLQAMIDADPTLQTLYSNTAFVLELNGELIPLSSQLLKERVDWYTLVPGDQFAVHMPRQLFDAACPEFLRNTLFLQLLRDTPVVYGDEQRTKQEHVFTYQIYANCLEESTRFGADHLMADLSALIELHRPHYRHGVRNNLFFTTFFLREYHYQKQRGNAFYHIQAINLPFQNFEFNYPAI